jgi:hypothetical protein
LPDLQPAGDETSEGYQLTIKGGATRAPASSGGTRMQKITEEIERITVFRNQHGEPVGIIIAEDESTEPLYGAFIHGPVSGWKWLSESTDREKVFHEAREHFFYHSHFCPECRFDVDCEHSYKCQEPDKDQVCEDCRQPETTEDAHLEADYEARTALYD